MRVATTDHIRCQVVLVATCFDIYIFTYLLSIFTYKYINFPPFHGMNWAPHINNPLLFTSFLGPLLALRPKLIKPVPPYSCIKIIVS